MSALNTFLFVAFPYVAVVTFTVGMLYRWRQKGFTVSSLSSQFLEGKTLFWGTIPFHIGLLVVLFGHLAAFLLPDAVLAWNSRPLRLVLLEGAAFAFGVTVVIGLAALMVRRATNARIRAVTTPMDVAIELLVLVQVVLGCWIALGFRWGSSWFASDLTPYLWSLVTLSPETAAVFAMPWVIKLHIAGAFAIVFMVPFTRLAHVIVAPLHYVVRPYQPVMWNWDRKKIRDTSTRWTVTRPRSS